METVKFVEPPTWVIAYDDGFYIDPTTNLPFETRRRAYASVVAMWLNVPCEVVRADRISLSNPLPWTQDIAGELAFNSGPYTNSSLNADAGWWKRDLSDITHVTIHHTMSDSPHATAKHYIGKDGGRPTIPYTIWIAQTGEILLCVPLSLGLWHDHTGHKNLHLSVGMAGRLHEYAPSDVQLDATAKVCTWAISSPDLPLVDDINKITGHCNWIETQCPGWDQRKGNEASGRWETAFFDRVELQLKGKG